jgi:hypothetical protein
MAANKRLASTEQRRRSVVPGTIVASQDCDCLCHKGGVVLHVVTCCDGMLTRLSRRRGRAKASAKPK